MENVNKIRISDDELRRIRKHIGTLDFQSIAKAYDNFGFRPAKKRRGAKPEQNEEENSDAE